MKQDYDPKYDQAITIEVVEHPETNSVRYVIDVYGGLKIPEVIATLEAAKYQFIEDMFSDEHPLNPKEGPVDG